MRYKIFIITEKGKKIPCTLKNKVIKPVTEDGYKMLNSCYTMKISFA